MSRRGPKRRSALACGFVALDIVRSAQGVWLRAGGTAANVAANLAYFNWKVSMLGQIGDDDAGLAVEADLRSAGLDLSRLRRRKGLGTPLVVHEISDNGHRYRFGCSRCRRAYSSFRAVGAEDFVALWGGRLGDVFFFDRVSVGVLLAAEEHARAGRIVMYEPAKQGFAMLQKRAIELANIVKYSRERAARFERPLPSAPKDQLRIETSGAEGARFRFGGGPWVRVRPFHAPIIDAGGAGDWMTAALLERLPPPAKWDREKIVAALRFAQAVAALSCGFPGARTLSDAIDARKLHGMVRELVGGKVPTQLTPGRSAWMPRVGQCDACFLPLDAGRVLSGKATL